MKTFWFAARPALPLVLIAAMAPPLAAQTAPARDVAPAPLQLAQVAIPAASPVAPIRAAAAPSGAAVQPVAASVEAAIQPVDLARYTCQDLMMDMLNKQLDRINLTVTVSWGLARAKDDPTNTRLDFAQVKPRHDAVWKSCALGDRTRHVRDVVADEIKTARSAS